jgi:hypothetical protein
MNYYNALKNAPLSAIFAVNAALFSVNATTHFIAERPAAGAFWALASLGCVVSLAYLANARSHKLDQSAPSDLPPPAPPPPGQ